MRKRSAIGLVLSPAGGSEGYHPHRARISRRGRSPGAIRRLVRGTPDGYLIALSTDGGGGIVTYEIGGTQYIAAVSGRPSPLWPVDNAGAPTIVVFKVR
jgi:hypothetical protein